MRTSLCNRMLKWKFLYKTLNHDTFIFQNQTTTWTIYKENVPKLVHGLFKIIEWKRRGQRLFVGLFLGENCCHGVNPPTPHLNCRAGWAPGSVVGVSVLGEPPMWGCCYVPEKAAEAQGSRGGGCLHSWASGGLRAFWDWSWLASWEWEMDGSHLVSCPAWRSRGESEGDPESPCAVDFRGLGVMGHNRLRGRGQSPCTGVCPDRPHSGLQWAQEGAWAGRASPT